MTEHRSEQTVRQLTPADVRELDDSLSYYRAGPPGGCSQEDIVSLSLARGSRTMITERYVDQSCVETDDEGEHVTTLWDLIRRMEIPQ